MGNKIQLILKSRKPNIINGNNFDLHNKYGGKIKCFVINVKRL